MNGKVTLLFLALISSALLATSVVQADETPAAATVAAEPLYAWVNGKPVTLKDFNAAYAAYLRQKYYHGQIAEDQIPQAKKEAGDRLIDRMLLLEDAKRRGLMADEDQISKQLAVYEGRYAASEMWQQNRERLLPGLKEQLVEQQLIAQMEKIGREFPEPSDDEVKAYYASHAELFTEPEKLRIHTILLQVAPSAPKATWDAAREEAQRIFDQIVKGASFEDLAKLHSNDGSADKGGDMGYLHRGMIPDQVLTQIEAHPLGQVTSPIVVLEGVALFRLDERVPSRLMAFDDVTARARELLKREKTGQVWESFLVGLRANATIQYVEPGQPAK